MSQQQYTDILDNQPPESQPGDLDRREVWWAARQEALEVAGYMLRSRYRPGWIPSWRGTDKFFLDVEDGQVLRVSAFFAILVPVPTNFPRCAWVWTPFEFLMGDQ